MAETICAKFISKKVRKIRWKPRDNFGNPNPDYFLTGTWDDQENLISLWHCPSNENCEPTLVSSIPVASDVNDLHFYDKSTFAAAMGNGSVKMIRIQGQSMQEIAEFQNIHHYRGSKAPCTSVVSQSTEIASVGEDGKLNLMKVNNNKPYRTIEADSCCINAAIFSSQHEILTANSRGMMKMWDLRSASNKAVQTASLAEDSEVGAFSVDRHPFQGHIIAVGSYDGMLTIFDMRKYQVPVTVLAGPDSCLTEVRFHPDKADHLFSSSESGAVWHWSTNQTKAITTNFSPNVWLSGDLATQQLDIKEVLPTLPLAINSLDVSGERLICGGDNEAFYYVPYLVF